MGTVYSVVDQDHFYNSLKLKSLSLLLHVYKNGHTDVCLFVCLSLVCGGLMEIQTPAQILLEFWKHIPTCPKKVLVQVWPPPPPPLSGPGGPKTLKAEKDTLQIKVRV